MPSYKIEQCHHIKANGARCGSPALRKQRTCYFHHHHPPIEVGVWESNVDRSGAIILPVIEDATSIVVMVRKITELLLARMIQPKAAGLLLYGLQIASSNLKRLEAEKPQPEDTVCDTPTAETAREIEQSGQAESPAFVVPDLDDMDPSDRDALIRAVYNYRNQTTQFEEQPNLEAEQNSGEKPMREVRYDLKACADPAYEFSNLRKGGRARVLLVPQGTPWQERLPAAEGWRARFAKLKTRAH
jgi:hypothetical protein